MIYCYAHGGSDNHGCEAILRGTKKIVDSDMAVYSSNVKADKTYNLENISVVLSDSYKKYYHPVKWFFTKAMGTILKNQYSFSLVDGKKQGVYLFVGGDNYCYPGLIPSILKVNERLREQNCSTVLWGTSIEPEVLDNPVILEDIEKYDFIFARESLTYKTLLEHGLEKKTQFFPDPAFAMEPKKSKLVPEGLFDKPVIGLNISPLIMKYTKEGNVIREGYEKIIRYILNQTDYNIALIPHVVKRNNNDLTVIRELAEKLKNERIYVIEDQPAEELKYIISKCEFFVGARTHSTIAAYSTCVPTLVIGYSIKAKGIATDIFGTDEGYVVDVRSLKNSNEMLQPFLALFKKRDDVRLYMKEFMPGYKEKAKEAGQILSSYIEGWSSKR